MFRVLIVSENEEFVSGLENQLQKDFYVEACGSGKWALTLINNYSPDIVIVDNVIADMDCMAVLQAIRASGKLIHIIVYSSLKSPYIENRLEGLGVDMLIMKPCKLDAFAGHIRGLAHMIENRSVDWDIEQVLDNLLMELGFCVGANRYHQVRETILLRYSGDAKMLMKELYVDVAKKCGTNSLGVEKAIRDAIKAACKNGEPELWSLLFSHCTDERRIYPSNEEFIGRIALALRQRSRVKPSYKDIPAKIV